MGRVKLEIKKIQNTTNRQVTFSKRRNGLLKKAYELSVLCEVDVAVIMFSPSGRGSLYCGNNKTIEDIMARYVNLPEHERQRLQNQEYLTRVIAKLKEQAGQNRQESSAESGDSQLQEELKASKSHMEEMERRLSIYESDPSEITTLDEVHYREHVLEQTLKQIRIRKQILEGNYHNVSQTSFQVQMQGAEHMNLNGANNVFQWFPQRDPPQVQVLNFLGSNGLLPQREQTNHSQGVERMMMPSLNLLSGGHMTMEEHMGRGQRNNGPGDQEDVKIEPNNNAANTNRVRARVQDPSSSGYAGQAVDVNLNAPWANHQFYQPGNDHALPSEQPRERALLELFYSQFTPADQP